MDINPEQLEAVTSMLVAAGVIDESHVKPWPTVRDAVQELDVNRHGSRKPLCQRTWDTYAPYLDYFIAHHGDEPLNHVTLTDLQDLHSEGLEEARMRWAEEAERLAKLGKTHSPSNRAGISSSFVDALRCLYGRQYNLHGRHIELSPARKLKRIARNTPGRRRLHEPELRDVFDHAVRGSRDPDLDLATVWAGYELGARPVELLTLTHGAINRDSSSSPSSERATSHADSQPQPS